MENKKPFEKVWTFENFCSAYKAAFKHKRYRNTEDGKLKYKYYSTQRPVGPGTYPKPAGNPATAICNYDDKKHVPEIGRSAWGYVEYDKPLRIEDMNGYELIPAAFFS